MELVDGLQQALNFVSRLVKIVLQKLSRLFAPLDLGLKVLDRAVDVSDTACFGAAGLLEVFEL